jgi:hypothetical protein
VKAANRGLLRFGTLSQTLAVHWWVVNPIVGLHWLVVEGSEDPL